MTKVAAGSLLRTVFSRQKLVLFGLRSSAGWIYSSRLWRSGRLFGVWHSPKPGMSAFGGP